MRSYLSKVKRTVPRVFASILILILGLVAMSSSQANTGGDNSVLPWVNNYTLIILNTNSISELRQAEQFIRSQGGLLGVDVPPHVITGWIASETAAQLIGKHGIIEAIQEPVDETGFASLSDEERFLINYFNRVTSGRRSQEILQTEPGTRGGLLPDALEKGAVSLDDVIRNLKNKGLDLQLLGIQKGQEGKLLGTSDAMVGTVTVRIFWVESNGAIDPNYYSWNAGDVATIRSEITDGLNWWAAEASSRMITLGFTLIANTLPAAEEMQPYEPVLHSSGEDYMWINAIMANIGFSAGDKLARTTAYDNYLKNTYSSNWAYCAFVGYNPSPAPSTFTDGYSAYAYLLGPYAQLLYRNDGWTVSQFHLVFPHETGHIFGACDEYYVEGYGGCTGCASCNPLRPDALNGNCEHNCNSAPVACMMRANNQLLCNWTPVQIGWTSYNTSIQAHCYTEGAPVSVSITMDGSPTGYYTPHTFTSLTGNHTFTVPNTDPSGHPFTQWNTGATSTTISVSSAGTHTAYYLGSSPILTLWGVIILVALIIISGIFIIRKRRRAAVPV